MVEEYDAEKVVEDVAKEYDAEKVVNSVLKQGGDCCALNLS